MRTRANAAKALEVRLIAAPPQPLPIRVVNYLSFTLLSLTCSSQDILGSEANL